MRRRRLLRRLRRDLAARTDVIADMLGLPPRPFLLRWALPGEFGNAVAVTYDGVIALSWDWFREHPRDYGALAHEYTHLVQNVPPGTCPSEVIEGIADAVRYRLGLYESWWTPSTIARSIADLSDEEFRELSRSMASGSYRSFE